MTRDRLGCVAAALVCVVLAALWAPSVSMDLAWGWDETMHAELPALRMWIAGADGDPHALLRAVHDCEQYPFGWPALLAAIQGLTGPSEHAARMTGRCLWAIGLFGLYLLGRELAGRVARNSDREPGMLAPWLALALGAASPLALCYSGTLFLEVPFVVASVFALRAWLRRAHDAPLRRELAAGALVATAFFVKFNYGLMLGFGLFLDLAFEALAERRAGRGAAFARRTIVLASIPAAAFAWWFLVPLPFGSDTAASHRTAFVAFLGGNRSSTMDTPWSIRAMHWSTFLAWSPRVLLAMLAGALASLRWIREPAVRALWLVALASTIPVASHSFHLDRFLLPGAVLLWVLAGFGIARALPAPAWKRAAILLVGTCAVAIRPDVDGMLVARAVGLARPEIESYQRDVLTRLRDLRGARALETNGLERATYERLLDLHAAELRTTDVVGWVGNSHIYSPLAMHAGLWIRGGCRADGLGRAEIAAGHFEEDFVSIGNDDPHWSDAQLAAWTKRFSVLLTTDPVDMTENPNRKWLTRYEERVEATGEFEKRKLGEVRVVRPLREPIEVGVFALRRAP